MINNISDSVTLNNDIKMPFLGFGTNHLKNMVATKAVTYALEAGYRNIDTATLYGNEAAVSTAIKNSGIPREEIFLTTKLWTSTQNREDTLKAFDKSRKNLDMDYIDLYLINSPVTPYQYAWETMVELYEKGLIRAIGVCNFNIKHLENLQTLSNVPPAVNQVEYHPWLTQVDLLAYCKSKNIQLEAWSPLCRGELTDDKKLKKIGAQYEKTPAQVALRWDLQSGVITIPSSSKKSRVIQNSEIFDFTLSDEDMDAINKMNKNKRWMYSYGL